jgi:DNA-binding response OmpR family regulator
MGGKPRRKIRVNILFHTAGMKFQKGDNVMNYEVMIVDDDESIRIALKELFHSEGINVIEAEGVNECLNKLDEGFKGVILMDIMMPEKDGWDAVRAIIDRNLFKGDILIVMLTAKDVPDEKMQGLQEYVVDYITKPFESEELVSKVKDHFLFLNQY